MDKIPVLIDCSPRCENSPGLLLALLREEFELLGIVVPSYPQKDDKAYVNALKITELAGCDVPVVKGALKPFLESSFTGHAKDANPGYKGLPSPSNTVKEENYVDFLYRTIVSSDVKPVIITMGPLTDLGALLLAYPDCAEKIDKILVAGGSYIDEERPALATLCAEQNILSDPEAANIVFSAGIPVVMFGDNVSSQLTDKSLPEAWKGSGTTTEKFVFQITKCHTDRAPREPFQGSILKSACPVAYLLQPELFVIKNYAVTVNLDGGLTRGCTIVDHRFETGRSVFVPTHTFVAAEVDKLGVYELIKGAFHS